MTGSIATVTGEVGLDELGPILYHEHVVLDNRRVPGLEAYWLPGEEVMSGELRALRAAGGRSLVSLTNQCMGRDIAALHHISAAARVWIIAATGLYTRPASPRVPSVEALAKEFVRELTVGIGETGVRAGVIGEIGTGAWPVGEFERNLFDAAALAHLETGAPIATHTHGGKYASWQFERLTRRGVPPGRIVIGHVDEGLIFGMPYLERIANLARKGCLLGFDTVGITYYSAFMKRHQPSDQTRANAVRSLVDMGLADQLMLSHDICRPDHLSANGGWGYTHIFNSFLPMLERCGVDGQTARKFLVDNPLRWLRK